MPKSKYLSTSLISNSLQFAKKISDTGLDLLGQARPKDVSRLEERPEPEQIIEGQVQLKSQYDQLQTSQMQYQQPQLMLRAHLSLLSKQLLGRHFLKVNMVSQWVSPQLNDWVSDYLCEHLNVAVSQWSSVEDVLNQTGEKELQALAKDVARSGRISRALANQNRIWAATQGGVSGLMGVLGAAFNVPCSLMLALRSVYQTGRAYGFELNSDDHAVVEYVFKQIDFASLAEKQALLALLSSTQDLLVKHDLRQLQQILGSSNDAELLRHFLFDEQGRLKWTWLSNIPQLNLLSKLTRLGSAGVGAFYSLKLVEESTQHAKVVFAQARQYLIDHPEQQLDPLAAFLAAQHQLQCQRINLQLELDQDLQQIALEKAESDAQPIAQTVDIQKDVEEESSILNGDQNNIASATTAEQKVLSSGNGIAHVEVDIKVQEVVSSEVPVSDRRRTSVKTVASKTVSAEAAPAKAAPTKVVTSKTVTAKTATNKTASSKTPSNKSAVNRKKNTTVDASSADVPNTVPHSSVANVSSSQIQEEQIAVSIAAKTPSRRLGSGAKAVNGLVEMDTKNNKN